MVMVDVGVVFRPHATASELVGLGLRLERASLLQQQAPAAEASVSNTTLSLSRFVVISLWLTVILASGQDLRRWRARMQASASGVEERRGPHGD
jgi:hypothetical protein